jgi:hypothetical protein
MTSSNSLFPSALMSTPQFSHDCDCCYFLGRFEYCDLYHCDGALIARFSSVDQEYSSMPVECVTPEMTLLFEAKTRMEKAWT